MHSFYHSKMKNIFFGKNHKIQLVMLKRPVNGNKIVIAYLINFTIDKKADNIVNNNHLGANSAELLRSTYIITSVV